MTTAFLVLRMAIGDFRYREVPFDQILDEVKAGDADVGLIIHEGQLTYADEGLEKVLDLGEWWLLETGLPLPLGANVARRDLGDEVLAELSTVLQDSIRTGPRQSQRGDGVRDGVQPRPRAAPRRPLRRHVRQRPDVRLRRRGSGAVEELLRRAEALGAYERPVRVEFVS